MIFIINKINFLIRSLEGCLDPRQLVLLGSEELKYIDMYIYSNALEIKPRNEGGTIVEKTVNCLYDFRKI